MSEGRTRRPRRRRKVRWGRVFLLLIFLIALIGALTWAGIYAYKTFVSFKTAEVSPPARQAPSQAKQINILLLGLDEGDNEHPGAPQRSDAMVLASIRQDTGAVTLLSIPRDTRVAIPGQKGQEKIAHAYYYGGSELAAKTVEELLNVPVNYFVVIDWQAFIKVVDILGGVNLYVERDMNYDDPYADLHIHLLKGYQHLDGQKAGEYVRFRSDELGDVGRVQRQQRFLKVISGQFVQPGTILKLPALVSAVKQHVKTDMTFWSYFQAGRGLRAVWAGEVQTVMLPGSFSTIGGVSYWVPNQEQLERITERLQQEANAAVMPVELLAQAFNGVDMNDDSFIGGEV
ncbi:MAG: cell envelope-related transcriptional attenuator [Firmicutes bacterium]|nr:cell envelope-related transcriptional attenuator [Bacillota bacterium]